jgi:hypothetical protein
MKSLEKGFNKIRVKNHNWSSYVCFAAAVQGKKFERYVISKWFVILVDENDYAKNERKNLLENLFVISNIAERGKNRG